MKENSNLKFTLKDYILLSNSIIGMNDIIINRISLLEDVNYVRDCDGDIHYGRAICARSDTPTPWRRAKASPQSAGLPQEAVPWKIPARGPSVPDRRHRSIRQQIRRVLESVAERPGRDQSDDRGRALVRLPHGGELAGDEQEHRTAHLSDQGLAGTQARGRQSSAD